MADTDQLVIATRKYFRSISHIDQYMLIRYKTKPVRTNPLARLQALYHPFFVYLKPGLTGEAICRNYVLDRSMYIQIHSHCKLIVLNLARWLSVPFI